MNTNESNRTLRELLDKAIELDWEVEIVEETCSKPQIGRNDEGDPIGNPPYRQHIWCERADIQDEIMHRRHRAG